MPPTLRKRPAPAAEPATAPSAKKGRPAVKKEAEKKEEPKKKAPAAAPKATKAAVASGTGAANSIAVGSVLDLDGFGGSVETHEGKAVSLKSLAEESKAGVILFTYPKASTPGCTKQVRNFNSSFSELSSKGFAVYGLSKDSTKANTNFHDKQSLTYPLLCDPSGTLITAIGLKKEPSGTTRGVFVIDKSGKVLAAQAGSPDSTLSVAMKVLEGH